MYNAHQSLNHAQWLPIVAQYRDGPITYHNRSMIKLCLDMLNDFLTLTYEYAEALFHYFLFPPVIHSAPRRASEADAPPTMPVAPLAPRPSPHNPFAVERPHAAPHLLERQGSFRGFAHLNNRYLQATGLTRAISIVAIRTWLRGGVWPTLPTPSRYAGRDPCMTLGWNIREGCWWWYSPQVEAIFRFHRRKAWIKFKSWRQLAIKAWSFALFHYFDAISMLRR